MNEDPYKSPESNVVVATVKSVPLPNPFIVAVMIIVVSVLIKMIIAGVEYLLGTTLPANTFLSTIIPALSIGIYYGKKRGDYFPRNFRFKVVLIWLVLGIVLSGIVLSLFFPDLLPMLASSATYTAIFIGMVFLGVLFCYFALHFGEKLGIKSLETKA